MENGLPARVRVLEALRIKDQEDLHDIKREVGAMNARLWVLLAGVVVNITIHLWR